MTTYCGPQNDAVAALVERARRLTPDEIRALAAAWRAAATSGQARAERGAARDAADDAAWSATWDAPHDHEVTWIARAIRAAADQASQAVWAAWETSGNTWSSAQPAARSAAAATFALATRHLIGQYDYTQAHYDVLVGPWASVIGSVHPDDPAL